ncbi:Hydroxypyruvate isomerase [Sporomusa silvacetica DSM 10669]|uniref:Hydroxypyruvate isomerase n=1 Tax=Sporomusa silvacetica DSM 10669 TaxID=1123289 RepID=A0ABZ3IN36_9FIRM|nr:TIM barrel protein [Sporomusa silvacetica]OZC14340.1 hydroxypyruvate isomerase [Sporomusa silvacetica DSM 10669]
MRQCACIDTLYTELPWEKRFQAAKNDGFESVEFWDWRNHDLDCTRTSAEKAKIKISGFNGDADFSLIDPKQKEKYLDFLQQSIAVAKKIGAESVTIHSNALGPNGVVVHYYTELSNTVKLCSMYDTLLVCAKLAEESGIQINLEALNIITDHVGNFLQHTQMAAEITRLIHSPKLKILYDIYHMQLNEGSICDTLHKYHDQIGHIHVADVPGRHEPGTGEIHYIKIFQCLKSLQYKGRIGYELFPKTHTQEAVKAIMSYWNLPDAVPNQEPG